MRGGWRTWTGLWLLMATAITACAPALPTRTDPSWATPTTDPPGVEVVVEASGRFACDWVVGCGAFVEIVRIPTLPIEALPDGWEPARPYLLATSVASDAPPVALDVGPPEAALPRLAPGTYRVAAGVFWVDDGPSQEPGTFPASVVPSPCVAPLVIEATTAQATVAVRFEPDAACTVRANPGPPVETGARLAVRFDGALGCALFPYACSVTLSVLPAGTDVPDDWRPPITDPWWGADGPGDQSVDPQAIGNVPTLPPGSHRLVASVLGSYDTPSYAPDGSVARDLLARCWLDVDIEPATAQVAVRISLEPDGTSFGGTCSIDLVP